VTTGFAHAGRPAPSTVRAVVSIRHALETYLAPLVDLAVRIVLFRVFFWSGLTKLDDWQSTLYLFEYEYQVPLLPVPVAAILGTAIELGASTFMLIGLFARLAALPMLGLAMVIQFVLGAANPAYNDLEHFLWMALLLVVIAHGPGALSLDAWIAKRLRIR
jgi:putative oxidoreductase